MSRSIRVNVECRVGAWGVCPERWSIREQLDGLVAVAFAGGVEVARAGCHTDDYGGVRWSVAFLGGSPELSVSEAEAVGLLSAAVILASAG